MFQSLFLFFCPFFFFILFSHLSLHSLPLSLSLPPPFSVCGFPLRLQSQTDLLYYSFIILFILEVVAVIVLEGVACEHWSC